MTDWEVKQVIVVRTDIKMEKGKIAVQVAHAAVLGSEKAMKMYPKLYKIWKNSGMAKIAVRVSSLDELRQIEMEAKRSDIPVSVVQDMGLTQVDPGTVTCAALGPAMSSKLDKITSDLRLL